MPHKKRTHGKKTKGHGDPTTPVGGHQTSKPTATHHAKSQPSQATPTAAAQVSSLKPAQFEKASSASGMAAKPGGTTGTTGKVTPKVMPETALVTPNTTVIDMASAEARGSTKDIPKTAAVSQVKATAAMSAAPATGATAGSTASTKPKESPKGTAKSTTATTTIKADLPKVDPAKGTPTKVDTAKGAPAKMDTAKGARTKVDPVKEAPTKVPPTKAAPSPTKVDPIKGAPTKVDPAKETPTKVDPTKVTKSASAAATASVSVKGQGKAEETKPSQSKVQVEVAPPAVAKAAKEAPAEDPFDALASSLSPSQPLIPPGPQPVYTGPEVIEHGINCMEGVLCGERDDTLPPGYRFEDMPPAQPDVKPKDEPKPMSTDEAMDSLSFGFGPAPPQKEKKMESASSAGFSNFAPPPYKKPEGPAVVSPVKPPADKKAKVDKAADDFCLMSGLEAPVDTKPKTDEGTSMSLDALSALGDSLGAPEPTPEPPKLRPEDIISEGKVESERGVRVGERDDTLPPEYRFTEDSLKDLPAPKPEPSMGAGEALDFLSGGFMSPSVAPAAPPSAPPPTQPSMDTGEALDLLSGDFMMSSSAPAVKAVTPSAPPPTQAKVEDLSALDLLAGDFVAPSKSSSVQAPMPPPTKKTPEKTVCPVPPTALAKPTTDEDASMSLDALSALGDTLAAPEPAPELPKLRPEDIVSEGKVDSEKGVLVGEREDTLPPEYRFTGDKLKDLPALQPEPSMDTGEALDLLSGDFMMSSSAPAVKAVTPSAPPAQLCADSALDALAGDFVAPPTVAPAVKSAVSHPTETSRQLSSGTTNALDALSDTLMDTTPAPEPVAPVPTKDMVEEKKAMEERLIKMGERDDSLPAEYRPTEEDRKAAAEAKAKADATPKQSMSDADALDLLSGDFSAKPAAPAPASSCAAATPDLIPPVLDQEPLKPMSGPLLDSLSDTLVPNVPEFKSKGDKPKGKGKSRSKSKKQHAEDPSAVDQLSGQLSTDVVSTSTKKGGHS